MTRDVSYQVLFGSFPVSTHVDHTFFLGVIRVSFLRTLTLTSNSSNSCTSVFFGRKRMNDAGVVYRSSCDLTYEARPAWRKSPSTSCDAGVSPSTPTEPCNSNERLCRGTPKQATPSHPPRLLCTFPHERSLAPGTGPREFSDEPACLA